MSLPKHMKNIWKILVLSISLVISLSACSAPLPQVQKIALIAPFEGRYREIGYNAFYAVQLAFQEAETNIQWVAIDDGGSLDSANLHLQALMQDPTMKRVLIVGPFASQADALQQMPIDTIIIGYWGKSIDNEHIFYLSQSESVPDLVSVADWAHLALNEAQTAGDLFGLAQVPLIFDETGQLSILSSGQLPDEAFRQRYLALGEFVPEPNQLASLIYDATMLSIEQLTQDIPITETDYTGINGPIHFAGQFWQEAPVYHYEFNNRGSLSLKN